MNFKIPKIKIPSAKNSGAEEAAAEAAPSAPTFTVSEDQLRKLWAGEIAFGILSACVAVVIAFIG